MRILLEVFPLVRSFFRKKTTFFCLSYFYICSNEINLPIVDPTCHFLNTFRKVNNLALANPVEHNIDFYFFLSNNW